MRLKNVGRTSLGVYRLEENLQKHLKESFRVIIWWNISSISKIITFKSDFSTNSVFLNP